MDCNSNDVPDADDITAGTSVDLDTNGVPDECQPDCNTNGVVDACEVAICHNCCETEHGMGCSDPGIEACVCDEDRFCCQAVWDETCVAEVVSFGCGSCEPASLDCNANGVPDECEPDCNANGMPDDCEPDFDGDGVIDACDPDIDNDDVPNETDVCDYTPHPLPPGAILQPNGTLRGDLDGDCDVDLADYLIFQQDFTGPLP